MWYLIGLLAVAFTGFLIYAGVKNSKLEKERADAEDKPQFRTEESVDTYEKSMNDERQHVDFEDME